MSSQNLLESLPQNLEAEVFEDILKSPNLRIERIVSKGHATPEVDWYDQEENEWVMVLEGEAVLVFDDGSSVALHKGSYLNIPAHRKHRVSWTAPDRVTVWLAVFYK
jgi:cupin 2 domain-containing protein